MKRFVALILAALCLALPVFAPAEGFENRNADETQQSLNEKYGFQIWTLPEGIETPDFSVLVARRYAHDGNTTDERRPVRLFEIDPSTAVKRVSDIMTSAGFRTIEYVQAASALIPAERNGYRYVNNVVGVDEKEDWSKVTKIVSCRKNPWLRAGEVTRISGSEYALHPLPFTAHLGECPSACSPAEAQ
jgi:hypothetical protein